MNYQAIWREMELGKPTPFPSKDDGRKLRCPQCGANAEASCDCHVDYKWEPGERARRAIEANPGKSDRAIADEIAVSDKTVAAARRKATTEKERTKASTAENSAVWKPEELTAEDCAVQKRAERRVGKDGKVRKMPSLKPKVEVASPVKPDDLSEALAGLPLIDQQRIETAIELHLKTYKQQIDAKYKQHFKQIVGDYEQQFEQRVDEGIKKYMDEWQREMCGVD